MTVVIEDALIKIDGVARVEDAETLSAALQMAPVRPINLAACRDVHAAVLQVLLAYQPTVTGLVENAALAEWLSPLLDAKPSMEAKS